MNILALCRYTRLGASSRVRFFQYIPCLESQGWTVSVSSFFSERYLQEYYRTGRKPPGETLRAYWRRISDLRVAVDPDLLWVEKEIFPYLPSVLESRVGRFRKPCVVDYDDATFHAYDLSPSRAIRTVLGGKIDTIMKGAATVIAGNGYLAERARRAGAGDVKILPSVVDPSRYVLSDSQDRDVFTVGWIGTPSISHYLEMVGKPLADICAEGRGRFVAIGASGSILRKIPAEARGWSEDTEAEEIRRFDVGIMPLPDTPWERGKCGYKLIQYMACGIPVVASPVGVNTEIVEHGRTGFLAGSDREWVSALGMLRDDPALRNAMGRAGRKKVEREYSLRVTAPRLVSILKDAAAG